MQTVHGINFAPFSRRGALEGEATRGELRKIQESTGADTVIFCPGAVQDTPFSQHLDFAGAHTTSDAELLAITRTAKDLGLRVFWKPTVNCLDGTWRAHISFFEHDVPCEPQWGPWFADYTAFQTHFARLAQQAGIELLILGCEMTKTEHREAEWRALIASVRSAYDGAVAYNCDKYGEEFVPWWDAVDVMASSGYYPIDSIAQNLDRIEPVVRRMNKPFFFAEAGCMRVEGSAQIPNDWTLQGQRDDQEQDRWYQALFAAMETHPWLRGAALWDWPLDADHASPYAFCRAPALRTIRSHWQKK